MRLWKPTNIANPWCKPFPPIFMLNDVAIFNLNSMSIAFLSYMSRSRFDAVFVGPKICEYYDRSWFENSKQSFLNQQVWNAQNWPKHWFWWNWNGCLDFFILTQKNFDFLHFHAQRSGHFRSEKHVHCHFEQHEQE